MNKKEYKAVAFDIDGTLYPNRRMYVHAFPSFLQHPRLVMAFGAVRKEIRKIEPIDNFQQVQAQLVSERLRITQEKAAKLIAEKLYQVWEDSFRGVKPFAGAKELILDLKANGLKLGVLSDFPVARKLEYMGLEGLWDVQLCSEETGYLKPHPQPFRVLADKLGVPPEEIIYVGNNYKYDVIGSKQTGMAAAHLASKPVENGIADYTFEDYASLRRWIAAETGLK